MKIDGRTRTCGLIGNPVEHTLSPVIHNHLASLLGQNLIYVPFHVENGDLQDAIKGAKALNILGCNVTVPYKSEVIPYLKELDPLAKKIGAVNTLVKVEGGFKGYNTDMLGLLRGLKEEKIDIEGRTVVILGAGGVARAVAVLLCEEKAQKIIIANRTKERAIQIQTELLKNYKEVLVETRTYDELKEVKEDNLLVIQATSVGLYPKVDEAVISDQEFYKKIGIAYDLIFSPRETKFLKLSKEAGARTYNGLKMLLYQGIIAYELWNDVKVSEEIIKSVYEKLEEEK